MNGTAITYRLTCGCTDWCNCEPCLAGTAHEEGSLWMCDIHGKTSIAWRSSDARPPAEAGELSVAVISSDVSFLFTAGHRMRAAHCLICGEMIGGEPVVLTGAAALSGDACECGQVVSDVFLAHARHWPMPGADLEAVVHRGLHCHNDHP